MVMVVISSSARAREEGSQDNMRMRNALYAMRPTVTDINLIMKNRVSVSNYPSIILL